MYFQIEKLFLGELNDKEKLKKRKVETFQYLTLPANHESEEPTASNFKTFNTCFSYERSKTQKCQNVHFFKFGLKFLSYLL